MLREKRTTIVSGAFDEQPNSVKVRKAPYRYKGKLAQPMTFAEIRMGIDASIDPQSAYRAEFYSRIDALGDTLDIKTDEKNQIEYWFEFATKLAMRHVPGLKLDHNADIRKPGRRISWDSTASICLLGLIRAKRAANPRLSVASVIRNIKDADCGKLIPPRSNAKTYSRRYYAARRNSGIVDAETFYAESYGPMWFARMNGGELSFSAPSASAFARYIHKPDFFETVRWRTVRKS